MFYRHHQYFKVKLGNPFIKDGNVKQSDDALTRLMHLYDTLLTNPPYKAAFRNNCLEHRLGKRLSSYSPDDEKNVKLLLAVSGAGKTRTLLELLHESIGFYFTFNQGDFGSQDLTSCLAHCNKFTLQSQFAIELLIFIRVSVCNHLMSLGITDPPNILLAQLHPVEFFGRDIFNDLFLHLANDPIFAFDIGNKPSFVVIDDVQVAVRSLACHTVAGGDNLRPFFSPMVSHFCASKTFSKFILAGTDFDLEFMDELLPCSTLKEDQKTRLQIESGFRILSRKQIKKYSKEYLGDHGIEPEIIDSIVARILSFELCHGRPGFLTFILDGYVKCWDIDFTLARFSDQLTDVNDAQFPLRFLKQDFDTDTFYQCSGSGKESLGSQVERGFVELMSTGTFTFNVASDQSPTAIKYGFGFEDVQPNGTLFIVIQELAVIECLRRFIPFGGFVSELMKSLSSENDSNAQSAQLVGYSLECLVAFALVANSTGFKSAEKAHVSHLSIADYITHSNDSSSVCFTDHLCGPDIVYKCTKTKTVYLCQVDYVKEFSQGDAVGAWSTTNQDYFYCKNGTMLVLRHSAKRLVSAALDAVVSEQEYTIKRLLFTLSATTFHGYGVEVINRETRPDFFTGFDQDIWALLDGIQSKFNQ